ncbi:hypothetical protein TRVL_05572 [Trypanosoma vivax]|nr:hypothetical protein TRVL_05572 [Trypanosoma vivax]
MSEKRSSMKSGWATARRRDARALATNARPGVHGSELNGDEAHKRRDSNAHCFPDRIASYANRAARTRALARRRTQRRWAKSLGGATPRSGFGEMNGRSPCADKERASRQGNKGTAVGECVKRGSEERRRTPRRRRERCAAFAARALQQQGTEQSSPERNARHVKFGTCATQAR